MTMTSPSEAEEFNIWDYAVSGDPPQTATMAKPRKVQVKKDPHPRWLLFNAYVSWGMASQESSDSEVWLILYYHAGKDGVACVPMTRIMKRTGLAENTITKALWRLRKAGWISRIQRGGPNGGAAKYHLQIPKPLPVS